ncbi:hypothetical protein Bbelb_133850 [Branchiostoma belcheri]|nr:hypothetical protein Bbelb_133850 [Branchiostoma belcheri]
MAGRPRRATKGKAIERFRMLSDDDDEDNPAGGRAFARHLEQRNQVNQPADATPLQPQEDPQEDMDMSLPLADLSIDTDASEDGSDESGGEEDGDVEEEDAEEEETEQGSRGRGGRGRGGRGRGGRGRGSGGRGAGGRGGRGSGARGGGATRGARRRHIPIRASAEDRERILSLQQERENKLNELVGVLPLEASHDLLKLVARSKPSILLDILQVGEGRRIADMAAGIVAGGMLFHHGADAATVARCRPISRGSAATWMHGGVFRDSQ